MKQFIFILMVALSAAILPFVFQTTSSDQAMEFGPRERYMQMLLADPTTGEIPHNARARELDFAQRFQENSSMQTFAKVQVNDNWSFAGPNALGGRTRAIAQDISQEQTLIAAGVSSGIFKSTDLGLTWKKKLRNDQLQSITCIVQDQRPGKTQHWYAGTGEFYGNSSDLNGDGIYKSTDAGESWELLSSIQSKTPNTWDGAFEF
ncbi:MAG: WD40/YVTN/BNR-like repeat-containing protein, partial [Ignavibacteria bacterium]